MLIIDGHNLIPKIPGLSLRDMDDEESLVNLLQRYARLARKKVVVFFDGAPPGQAGERVYGMVRANFVPAMQTADDAIRRYLSAMGKTARTATVVSSDRQVQANARELRARVLPSDDFARELSVLLAAQDAPVRQDTRRASQKEKQPAKKSSPPTPGAPGGSTQDMAQWIELFGLDPAHIDKPIDLSKRPAKHPSSGKQKQTASSPLISTEKKKHRKYHGFPKKP